MWYVQRRLGYVFVSNPVLGLAGAINNNTAGMASESKK